jgi:hypothetical protein
MEARGTQAAGAVGRQQVSRAQEKAKSYMQEHNIEKILSEMLNSLVHARDPKPMIFMVLRFMSLPAYRLST